jgi:hypothetical protein
MILMAIVALVLTLGMPKLMENSMCIDPLILDQVSTNWVDAGARMSFDLTADQPPFLSQWIPRCVPNSNSNLVPHP